MAYCIVSFEVEKWLLCELVSWHKDCISGVGGVCMCYVYMQPSMCDYNPVHFIRCHFGDKNAIKERHTDSDPTDNVTTVWCCAMEPDPCDPGLHCDYC